MKIQRIVIENYKSIKAIDIECSSKINAFIGENSVGKSNIFDAIHWMLGPVYPTFNNISANDHYLGDTNNKIKIKIFFDNAHNLCLDETGFSGRPGLKYSGSQNGGINDDTRCSVYGSACLGIDRQIVDYLPSSRWTLIGRLLLEINELFLKEEFIDSDTGEVTKKSDIFKQELENLRDNVLFTVKDNNGEEIMKKFITVLQRESAKQLNKSEASFKVDLNLYDPWNFYRTLQLLVHESDINLSFQASKLGMGVQASISIAVLKAYSEIKLRNSTPIFIDEPELFLHPQAQRHFYKVVAEMAENGTQVFFTTHSPNFLNVGRFNEIFVVRKNATNGTYIRYAKPQRFVDDLYLRIQHRTNPEDLMLQYSNAYENTGDTQKANEGFFAKRIILVEGESESLCLPRFFDLLKFDYIAAGITIVRCGGKAELDRFYRLYAEYGIPCFIIFDGDKHLEGTGEEQANIDKNKSLLALMNVVEDYPDNSVQSNFLGFEYTLNENLGFQSSQKGLKLYKQTKTNIQTAAQVPAWVAELVTKLGLMPDSIPGILQRVP